ncbi:MAG: imidazoleglycerol-phosphate dehydratase [Chaenotheca gracillima]|nr:MAG: imidazoleglycerol-phosphate dehydratase [Chaenotheca gracillima]
MGSRIDKTIARLQQRIEEGQYYEAHQQLRVVAARYVKQQNYDAAINILYSGAQSLLKAGQGGSGGDICLLLIEAYKNAELKPDSDNKNKITTLLRLFSPEEPSRKRFINELSGWSAKFGQYPAGDPELHHVIGALYAEEHEPYEAERHLVLGTRDSPEKLSELEFKWYSEDDPHTAALYAARAILPYLLIGNVRDAMRSLQFFTTRLTETHKTLSVDTVGSVKVFPALPLLNFLSLLLQAAQKGNADMFRQLKNRYKDNLQETASWNEALEQIGEMYFGIQVRQQTNPLLDMMGSLFGGGGSPAPPQSTSRRVQAPPPPAADLD